MITVVNVNGRPSMFHVVEVTINGKSSIDYYRTYEYRFAIITAYQYAKNNNKEFDWSLIRRLSRVKRLKLFKACPELGVEAAVVYGL